MIRLSLPWSDPDPHFDAYRDALAQAFEEHRGRDHGEQPKRLSVTIKAHPPHYHTCDAADVSREIVHSLRDATPLLCDLVNVRCALEQPSDAPRLEITITGW